VIDIEFNVETVEGLRSIRIIADKLADKDWLSSLLRRYDREWLRPRIDQRFESRIGWPARKEVTEKRIAKQAVLREAKSVSVLRRKLVRDVARARKRLGAVNTADGFFRERARQEKLGLDGKRSYSMSDVLRSRAAAVARREAVLAEFERLANGGDPSRPLTTQKQTDKLRERMERAKKLDSGEATLGRIAGSFKTEIRDGTLVDASEISWSNIHNEGGRAGHGAVEPPRPFAFLEDIDVRMLVNMIREDLEDDGGVILRNEG